MLFKRFFFLFLAASLLLAGCGGKPQAKYHTIAVMVEIPWMESIYDNFKIAMAELGYVEGENITYVYDPSVSGGDLADFSQEAKRLMMQNPDMFFTVGTLTSRAAKGAVEGTDIPVVFTPIIDVIHEGLVDSLAHPGGNVTGVQIIDQSAKGLEWALQIVPGTEYVYIPHHPNDPISGPITAAIMERIFAALPNLGVTLVDSEVTTADEMAAKVATLPEHTIIYMITPISSLEGGLKQLSDAARQARIPVITYNRATPDIPFSVAHYSVSVVEEARQGAHMADRILRGAKPADTPIETAEYFLTLDLTHAKQIGVTIPDAIISQASEVIR